uniref:RRM domain-containing protein n=1 Tax=Macrostomum lignano TaxID=282301 RepID=A0A1I8FUC2_9PLAT
MASMPEFQMPKGPPTIAQQAHWFTVGGLADEVDQKVFTRRLHSVLCYIVDISIPLDYQSSKHRGFAFLYGRTLRVNIARPVRIREGWAASLVRRHNWLKKFGGATLQNRPDGEAADGNGGGSGSGSRKSQQKRPPLLQTASQPLSVQRQAVESSGFTWTSALDGRSAGRIVAELRKDVVCQRPPRISAVCAARARIRGSGARSFIESYPA